MLRKLLILVVILALTGAVVFWFVTMPATVSASALRRAHAQSRERQDHVLRGRLRVLPRDARTRTTRPGSAAGSELKSPFGTFYAPNISPGSE